MPDTTVESSGGVMGLIQLNIDKGRCLFENPGEMLTKAALLLLLLLLYPATQVLWLASRVVFSSCGLQTAKGDPGHNMQQVLRLSPASSACCCCTLLLRFFNWAVVLLVLL